MFAFPVMSTGQEVAVTGKGGGNPDVPVNEPHLYASPIDHQSFLAHWVFQSNPNKLMPSKLELFIKTPGTGNFKYHSDVTGKTSVKVSTYHEGYPLKPDTKYQIKLKIWSGSHSQWSNEAHTRTKPEPGYVFEVDCCSSPTTGPPGTTVLITIYIKSTPYPVTKVVLDFGDGSNTKTFNNPGSMIQTEHTYEDEGKYHPTVKATNTKPDTIRDDCCVITIKTKPDYDGDCDIEFEYNKAIPIEYVDEEEHERYFNQLQLIPKYANPNIMVKLYKRVFSLKEIPEEDFKNEVELYGFYEMLVPVPGAEFILDQKTLDSMNSMIIWDDYKVSWNKETTYMWKVICLTTNCRDDRYLDVEPVKMER